MLAGRDSQRERVRLPLREDKPAAGPCRLVGEGVKAEWWPRLRPVPRRPPEPPPRRQVRTASTPSPWRKVAPPASRYGTVADPSAPTWTPASTNTGSPARNPFQQSPPAATRASPPSRTRPLIAHPPPSQTGGRSPWRAATAAAQSQEDRDARTLGEGRLQHRHRYRRVVRRLNLGLGRGWPATGPPRRAERPQGGQRACVARRRTGAPVQRRAGARETGGWPRVADSEDAAASGRGRTGPSGTGAPDPPSTTASDWPADPLTLTPPALPPPRTGPRCPSAAAFSPAACGPPRRRGLPAPAHRARAAPAAARRRQARGAAALPPRPSPRRRRGRQRTREAQDSPDWTQAWLQVWPGRRTAPPAQLPPRPLSRPGKHLRRRPPLPRRSLPGKPYP